MQGNLVKKNRRDRLGKNLKKRKAPKKEKKAIKSQEVVKNGRKKEDTNRSRKRKAPLKNMAANQRKVVMG